MNRMDLVNKLQSSYPSIEALQALCIDLGVDYESFGRSSNIKIFTLELVQYMQRRGRLGELETAVTQAPASPATEASPTSNAQPKPATKVEADDTAAKNQPVLNLFTISDLLRYGLTVSEQQALQETLGLPTNLRQKSESGLLPLVQSAKAEQKLDDLLQMVRAQYPDLPWEEVMSAPGLVATEPVRPLDEKAITKLLQEVLPEPSEFDAFFKANIPDFTAQRGEKIAVVTKSRELYLFCLRRNILPDLLALLQAEFPSQYAAVGSFNRPEKSHETQTREVKENNALRRESSDVLYREMERREQTIPDGITLQAAITVSNASRFRIRSLVWLDEQIIINPYNEPAYIWDCTETSPETITVAKALSLFALPQKNRVLALQAGANPSKKQLLVWDLTSKAKVVRIQDEKLSQAKAVTVTPDGKTAVTGHSDNSVRLWNLEIGQQAGEWHGHTNEVKALCVMPGGDFLLSAGEDMTLRVWDFLKGKQVMQLSTAPKIFKEMALSANGRFLATTYGENEIQIYQIEVKSTGFLSKKQELTITPVTCLGDLQALALSLTFSADGRFLAATIGGHITTIWRTEDWSEHTILPHTYGTALSFHPQRPLLAMSNQNNKGVRVCCLN